MRRDVKNCLYQNILNTDADCSFANAAAWTAGINVIDLRAANQFVDTFMASIKVLSIGTTVTFKMQDSMDKTTWTDLVPYKDQYSAASWVAITAAGLYTTEYRDTKRYVKMTCTAMTGTLVGYGWLVGLSQRNPIDRSVVTPAT